jgi:hypothetical protein
MGYICDVIKYSETFSSCHRYASNGLLETVANLLAGQTFRFLQTTDFWVLSARNVLFRTLCTKNTKVGYVVV